MIKPIAAFFAAILASGIALNAQINPPENPPTNTPPVYGPFNAVFLPGGDGLQKSLTQNDTVLQADSSWTLFAWIKPSETPAGHEFVAGFGDPEAEYSRYLTLGPGKLILWGGQWSTHANTLEAAVTLAPNQWHFIAATFDGHTFHLYSDGTEVASGPLVLGSVSNTLDLAPPTRRPGWSHFGGKIAGLTLAREALTGDAIASINKKGYNFADVIYEEGSKPWEVQTSGQAGYRAPQPPREMPRSKAPFQSPVAQPVPQFKQPVEPISPGHWTLAENWTMAEAPKVSAEGAAIASPEFSAKDWYAATVPGTVLTTLVDRGVYPNPYYGLNNLAIPETLNKQDYWYRNEFKAPAALKGKHVTLTFEGINYKAHVWLNGQSLGSVKGAFIRGIFDVSRIIRPGKTNVLAVRISPPPHPGIPQEQSIKGGPGANGGLMCLDGPTFVATEGWDWIPAIRDRDSGIWQPVTLTATDAIQIGDPQVITTLPLPDTSRANVEINVPLTNDSAQPTAATLNASFEGVSVSKHVTLAPGQTTISLTPAEFSQLTVQHPRLWWPNGYGKPNLYHLKLSVSTDNQISDTKQLHFGIREITYELSLLDSAGHLARVDYTPAADRAHFGHIVNVTHQGMRNIPPADPPPPFWPAAWHSNWHSYVSSLYPGAESSPSIRPSSDTATAPYLVVKVNGVKIDCRGGNWGMDDAMKHVSRAHLEPYFRLDRDAHLNIIRNWVGQSTEETFYDLADEYGMLVWNDFWESTQNYNIEAQDPQLFLKNVADVISRFRNHPSILLWCGRNEGVPQPIINEGIIHLVATLDGTRYYSPSSNRINLQDSGPYSMQNPAEYYTSLNHGFSVETGTPSMSTLEAFRASVPKPDQWPIDDAWAYHDWHHTGNGGTTSFMGALQSQFGAATSLPDFERKAQMLNYVNYRAIFEGMNAHLWSPNSGRLLWMTQPSWPSNMWEILSSDYDTQASYYGTMKACEPLHVQLDLANYNVELVNTTREALNNATVIADVYSLDNKPLLHRQATANLAANASSVAFPLDIQPLMNSRTILVKLQLKAQDGKTISQNLYWLADKDEDYRDLDTLAPAQIAATAHLEKPQNGEGRITVNIQNNGPNAALENKLTLLDQKTGKRILPAYYSDNYISLLPGETRQITIDYPASAEQQPTLTLRGWSLNSETVAIH